MDWTKMLIGILLALLVILFYLEVVAPYFIESSQEAILKAKEALARDLVGACKEWTDNLALDNLFPDDLEGKATTADAGWDYCRKEADAESRRKCRASCVKLLIIDDRCSGDPNAFGLIDYDSRAHTMVTLEGDTVEVTKALASQYCAYTKLQEIKDEVTVTPT